jgi:RHS repeat-associated protein
LAPRNRLTAFTRADADLDGAFDAEDFSATTAQSLSIAEGSNRLLGFTQTLSRTQGTRTLSTTSAQVAYSLDGAGNLTSDGLRSFGHDATGRLSQVRIGLGSEEAATTYLHNALGQRVFKSEPQATQFAPDEDELGSDFINWLKKNFGWLFAKAQANATLGQSFVYADAPLPEWALLGEYGNGGSKSAGRLEILWLPTEDGNAIPIGLYRNGRFYAVHPDHLGTPRLITNDANEPVWQWPYSAFGANKPTGILKATQKAKLAWTNEPILLKATNPALTFNLRFPGQYFDEESNLNYNYFRSYQPAQGRYSQGDPIGLEGGLNRFGYASGNAFSNTDPQGLFVPANHNGKTAEALRIAGSPCPDLPAKVSLPDFLPGSQATENSYWHAMSNGVAGESTATARAKYQRYVDEQIGSCSCARLARALHAIQDFYSPAHAGFQPWNGSKVPSLSHVYQDSYPSQAVLQQAVNASVSAIHRYKEKCTQCQR